MPTASGTPMATLRRKPATTSITVIQACSASSQRASIIPARIIEGGGRMNDGTPSMRTPASHPRRTSPTMATTRACSPIQSIRRRPSEGRVMASAIAEPEPSGPLGDEVIGEVVPQRLLLLDAAALEQEVERGIPELLALPAERLSCGSDGGLGGRPHLRHQDVAVDRHLEGLEHDGGGL